MAFEELLNIIDDRLAALKISERKACLNADLKVDAIRRIRQGFNPRVGTLQRLAAILGIREDLMLSLAGTRIDGGSQGMVLSKIVVRGHVQAGAWRDAIEWDGDEWYSLTVPEDERFPGIERFGLEVRGSSMDRMYPDRTVVICVRFADLARDPIPGERVICLRRSPGGGYEATVKEYQIDAQGRHVLWPKSTDPEFQTPIILGTSPLPVSHGYEPMPARVQAGHLPHDGGEPDLVITALVIQSVRRE